MRKDFRAFVGNPLEDQLWLQKSFCPYTLKYATTKATPMASLGRAVQALIIFSALLGAVFLVEVYGNVPMLLFEIVAVGWIFFVADSIMTFVRPRVSYMMGFALALLTLLGSLPESSHYAFLAQGEYLQGATFILGSGAQFALLVLVPYYFYKHRGAV